MIRGWLYQVVIRGLFIAGGRLILVSLITIEFITIATTGNATDFGDLPTDARGVWCRVDIQYKRRFIYWWIMVHPCELT